MDVKVKFYLLGGATALAISLCVVGIKKLFFINDQKQDLFFSKNINNDKISEELLKPLEKLKKVLEKLSKKLNKSDVNEELITKLDEKVDQYMYFVKRHLDTLTPIESEFDGYHTPLSNFLSADSDLDDTHNKDGWSYLKDGLHEESHYLEWKSLLKENSSLDYYVRCAKDYSNNNVLYRKMRTEQLELKSDVDFLIKLSAVREAFDYLGNNRDDQCYFTDIFRSVFVNLLKIAKKNPECFLIAYDDFVDFISDKNNSENIYEELSSRNVKMINIYDVFVDFMILDSFYDIENIPSSVKSCVSKTWIKESYREQTFTTLVWSLILRKSKSLKNRNGFMSKYYNLCLSISPTLAWGWVGDNGLLKEACFLLKDAFMGYIKSMFDQKKVSFKSLKELQRDLQVEAKNVLVMINTELDRMVSPAINEF